MKTIIIVSAFLLIAFACRHDHWEDINPKTSTSAGGGSNCDTSVVISYSVDIAPIMVSSCGANDNNCHNSATGSGQTVLDIWAGVNYCAVGTSPGKLVSCIVWDGNTSNMPLGGSKLSDCEIMKIRKWVNEGAPDN